MYVIVKRKQLSNNIFDHSETPMTITNYLDQERIQDFWQGRSNPSKGSSFSTFYPIFQNIVEIIWPQNSL